MFGKLDFQPHYAGADAVVRRKEAFFVRALFEQSDGKMNIPAVCDVNSSLARLDKRRRRKKRLMPACHRVGKRLVAADEHDGYIDFAERKRKYARRIRKRVAAVRDYHGVGIAFLFEYAP